MKVNYPSEEQEFKLYADWMAGNEADETLLIKATIDLIKQLNPEQNICNCNRCLGLPEEPEDK